jgi:heme oxygenase (biliverdin-IX-beta and delta-forming)
MAVEQAAENPGPERTPDAARRLLRAARVGSLGTVDQGDPFVSLVTPATAPDLTPLLLLSDLAAHTRHLRADPRCSLMVAGAATDPNPQTAPRVSLTARAEITEDPALRARFLAVHPYAALYAGFADFHLWQLRIEGAMWVGGFARAARVRVADLRPAAAAVAAIAAAAEDIMAHCNQDHPDALARIAGSPGSWRMAAVDPDGCDLADGERSLRIPWQAQVADPSGVRAELVRLARGGRS